MEELIRIKKQQKKLPSRFPSGIQAGHYQAPLSRSSGEIGVFCPNSVYVHILKIVLLAPKLKL